MNFISLARCCAVAGAIATQSGCVIGYDSVLMHTRTNFGVDIDTEPPLAEIAIGRKEGTIQPTFEGGQTVPTLASFRGNTTTNTGLDLGAGTAFLGGEAAHIMSTLYDTDTPEGGDTGSYPDLYSNRRVQLTKEPVMPRGIRPLNADGRVVPLVFGTDTSIGLRVASSAKNPGVPSSIKFGFNRKEIVLAPVTLRPVSEGEDGLPASVLYTADIPSFLATTDTNAGVTSALATRKETDNGDGEKDDSNSLPVAPTTGVRYLQYFATGSAATNLAYRREVRNAMIARTDPVTSFVTAIEGYSSSECTRMLLETWRAASGAGSSQEFEAALKNWLEKNGKKLEVRDLLFDPSQEETRCMVVDALRNGELQ